MYLTAEKKREILRQIREVDSDTGSPEGQIALFTFRIKHLTEHLRENKKDTTPRKRLSTL